MDSNSTKIKSINPDIDQPFHSGGYKKTQNILPSESFKLIRFPTGTFW